MMLKDKDLSFLSLSENYAFWWDLASRACTPVMLDGVGISPTVQLILAKIQEQGCSCDGMP